MKYLKLFLAFGLGWTAVVALGIAADAADRDSDTTSFQSRINALKRRVGYLDEQAKSGALTKKAVAPFEVDDRAGQKIFYVGADHEVEFYKGGKRVAVMSPAGSFGTLWALSDQGSATLTPRAFSLNDGDQASVDLGKDFTEGNYRLVLRSGGKAIAAIGISAVSKAGIALVADGSGSQKADMACPYDYGTVEVERGYGFTVTRLTESNGGYFIICSAQGCSPAMVEAGTDESGVGVVRTGPAFYNQGPTGAPGSFLIGKKQ